MFNMKKILLGFVVGLGIWGWSSLASATCDISSSFTAGQVLTAAQLNTFVTDSETCTNSVLDGDSFTGTMNFYSGADAVGYSDAGSTKKWELDSATGDAILSPRTLGTAINCEINYSAGTVTISGRGGVALSATNPCHIGIRSNSNGVVATATFTANVTATDGASSQTDGNLFGITDANWANAMPMFFGVIYDGTTPYFTVSRKPLVVSGAAAGNLCQLGDTDCDAEDDVMILTTGLTLSSWVNLPITQVAWLTATYATTGGAWTFAETAYTGFNDLYASIRFTFPTGQNGAATGTYLKANGGTAPIFGTNVYDYAINQDGYVTFNIVLDSDGGTDGSGGVNTLVSLPYLAVDIGTDYGSYLIHAAYGGGAYAFFRGHLDGGSPSMFILSATAVPVLNSDFSNGSRSILVSGSYKTF